MKLSNISTAPYRPKIKRLGQNDIPLSRYGSEFDSSSNLSAKRFFNNQQNRISPELDTSRAYHRKQSKGSEKKKTFTRKACFWVIVAVILFLIVGAIIGIVLGLILPISKSTEASTTKSSIIQTANPTKSTSATASTTTISIVCSHTGQGLIAFQNGSTSTTWTSYLYSYTATKTASTIVFGFETDGTNSFYLDTVSVVDTSASSSQLLINPNFENSTTVPTGWMVSCETASCGQSASRIETTSSSCSSGYCFESFCTAGRAALIFLSQTFTTINGNSHSISFMLRRTNIPSGGFMAFYLDVV